MRRFLMVGCGGSGGVTLQFVMDQLRADLRAVGVDKIPSGWQFVHVDVPISPDGVGHGMPPTVPDQGGRYAPVSSPAATYPQISSVVEDRLTQQGALRELGGWRPLPEKVDVPITTGAGQYRAVGRILTLSKAAQVRDQLAAAVSDMAGVNAMQEIRALAARISPKTVDQVTNDPVVLVVSSMAGGSGASMALDVCRLLGTVTGVQSTNISVFAYTPEVFRKLPSGQRLGIEANAAAMLGELIAAQVGAASVEDRRLLEALGLSAAGLAETPFRRVVPIGARIGGDGAVFGDGDPVSIYRGVGLGLSRLMMSPVAFDSFRKACLENPVALPVKGDLFGWGVSPDRLGWGSFGYASMGMGRERYAEYAAQRLARAAVDRLVEGHRSYGGEGTDEQQLTRLVDQTLWRQFARECSLPEDRTAVRPWFMDLLKRWQTHRHAQQAIEGVVETRLAGVAQQEGRQWVEVVGSLAAGSRQDLSRRVDDLSYQAVHSWMTATEQQMKDSLVSIVSTYGLPAASAVLVRWRRESHEWAQELATPAAQGPADIAGPAGVARDVLLQTKGRVPASSGQVRQLLDGHVQTVQAALGAASAGLMARLLPSMANGLVAPLSEALTETQDVLRRAREEQASVHGLALVHTLEYQAWPSGHGPVPPRFGAAQNEFPLTPVESFEQVFTGHISQVGGRPSASDSLAETVTTILRGTWNEAGALRTFDNLETRSSWRSPVFPIDPHDATQALRPEQTGRYRTAWYVEDVLDRARAYIRRLNEPFDQFIRQSLAGYLAEEGTGAGERADRQQAVEEAFGQALENSRPLVGVDVNAVQLLHGEQLRTYHSFTEIPFGEEVNAGLRKVFTSPSFTDETSAYFEDAIAAGAQSAATSVHIFGNSPNFSPAVFRSMLEPITDRWSSMDAGMRGSFWQWRRTRRLPACLPAGDQERRSLIGGWFVARSLGLLRYPGEEHAQGFEVYDRADKVWRRFPHPLLTDDLASKDRLDTLPAVLESMTLAVAQARTHPQLEPLKAYAALRRLFDSRQSVAMDAVTTNWLELRDLEARRLLSGWIRTGQPPGPVVPREVFAGPAGDDGASAQDARRTALTTIFGKQRDAMARFLPPGQHGSTGDGPFSTIRDRSQLAAAPMVQEIAEDAVLVLETLAAVAGERATTDDEVLM
jgi:hypothetical protein